MGWEEISSSSGSYECLLLCLQKQLVISLLVFLPPSLLVFTFSCHLYSLRVFICTFHAYFRWRWRWSHLPFPPDVLRFSLWILGKDYWRWLERTTASWTSSHKLKVSTFRSFRVNVHKRSLCVPLSLLFTDHILSSSVVIISEILCELLSSTCFRSSWAHPRDKNVLKLGLGISNASFGDWTKRKPSIILEDEV